jgi:hypothetical protein
LAVPKVVYLLQRARRDLGPKGLMLKLRQELGRLLASPRLVSTALAARRRTGKSLQSQAYEIARLRMASGLRPFDYYAYGLYDDTRYSFAEKKTFVSRRPYELYNGFNDPEWRAICDDKLISYGLFRGLSLPHPEIYAVYHPHGRAFGSVSCLRTPEEMADYLRRDMRYPFFGKPVKDGGGAGVSSVDRIDYSRDVLVIHDGQEIPVEEYVRLVPAAMCTSKNHRAKMLSGYLFQERVQQHTEIEKLTGGRIGCLRLMVLLGPEGPHLFRALWKIAVDNNLTEHTVGHVGNLRCSVDTTTGRIERVVQSPRPEEVEAYALDHHGREIDVHPNTQERLIGVQLPYWNDTVSLCLHAAAAFPGVRFQCWDIAMGTDGPLLIEVNYFGVVPQAQLPGCRGFYDNEFKRIVSVR